LAEDRPDAEVGLRFAVAGLARSVRDAAIIVYRPAETREFRDWAARYSNVAVIPESPAGASSWNCKPHALLPWLQGEFDEAVWIDSDMLVTRDPSPLFDAAGPADVVATEEPPGTPHVAAGVLAARWGLRAGRTFPRSLNSSVLRVTRYHIPLLRRWKEMLSDPAYVDVQRRPFAERPRHMLSDQDVLFALLGSDEFPDCSLSMLRGGDEIIHCGGALGYSLGMRLTGVFRRVPTFLHAISGKPWWVLSPEYARGHGRWFTFYRRLLQETSPYVRRAGRLRAEVRMDAFWIDYRSFWGWALRLLGCGHYALCGLPLTVVATMAAGIRRGLRT
jgi:hypothetical protein